MFSVLAALIGAVPMVLILNRKAHAICRDKVRHSHAPQTNMSGSALDSRSRAASIHRW